MNKTIVMTLTGIMMLCSCATRTISSDNISPLIGKWAIVEAMQKGVDGAEKAPFIQFKNDGQINGNASVNSFFGGYKVDGGKVSFSNLGMTRMFGKSMDIEDNISKAIGATATIEVKKDGAVMKDKDGKVVMRLKRQAE
ncbi:MAG: META domain-containing protein [Prevotella sp.]